MNTIHFTGIKELLPEMPFGDLVTVKTLTETGEEIPCTCITPIERCATGLPGIRVAIPSPEVRQIIVELPPLYYPGGEDEFILPRSAGKRMKNPAQSLFSPAVWTTTGWKDRTLSTYERGKLYPWEIDTPESEWSAKAALQFTTYGDGKRSVYLGCCDPSFENSFASIRCKRGEKALHLSYKKSWNCEKSGFFDFSFGVIPGDWRAAAKCYRKWFDTTGRTIRHNPVLGPGMMCHYDFRWQNGDINHRFRDLPQVAAESKAWGFDTILCAAWNEGGFDTNYPHFRPDPLLGTEQELIDGVKAVHDLGMKILFYNNGYSYDSAAEDFEERGKPGAVQNADGTLPGVRWGTRMLVPMCNGAKIWRERVLENVGYLLNTVKADGVYIDQFNVIPSPCHSKEGHDHTTSIIQRSISLVEEMRKRYGDKAILLSEWSIDAMATVLDYQLLQTVWMDLEYHFPQLFRYTFPEAGTIDMVLQKPWPGNRPEVEGRFVLSVYEDLFLCGIALWCYDHAPLAPGFTEYFKAGMELRLKYKELFAKALYRDCDEVTAPEDVEVRRFDLPDGKFLFTAVNRTGAEAQGTFRGIAFNIPKEHFSVILR